MRSQREVLTALPGTDWGKTEKRRGLGVVAYLDQRAHVFQRQPVAQHRLDEDPQRHDVRPHHDGLAPPGPTQPQRLAPDLLLLARDTVQLLLLLLLATLDVLVLARGPLLLSALLQELGAVLLESRDGKEHEFFVLGHLHAGPWHHHGRERLVALEKVLPAVDGHDDQMRLKVLGVGDEKGGIHDGREGLGREVSAVTLSISVRQAYRASRELTSASCVEWPGWS